MLAVIKRNLLLTQLFFFFLKRVESTFIQTLQKNRKKTRDTKAFKLMYILSYKGMFAGDVQHRVNKSGCLGCLIWRRILVEMSIEQCNWHPVKKASSPIPTESRK